MTEPIITYRPIKPGDQDALWDGLYYAIHVPPGEPAPARDLIHTPDIVRYFPDLARDLGVLALSTIGLPIGAAWLRLWTGPVRGYGFVDPQTPELSIAVWPGHRGQGIGTQLLRHLFQAADPIFPAISLSTARTNPAYRLYQRLHFETIAEDDSAYLMIRKRPF